MSENWTRLADTLIPQVNFTFGVEIFEPGHKTTPHVHQQAYELFFILAGIHSTDSSLVQLLVCPALAIVFAVPQRTWTGQFVKLSDGGFLTSTLILHG